MPKVVDHQQRRSEVVEAAVDAIAECGLDGVTLKDIAGRVGATTGTIGHYFRNKDEVLAATLDHLLQRLLGEDAEEMTFVEGGLGLYLPLGRDARRYWKVWVAYCGAAPTSPPLLAAYERFYACVEARMVEHLTHCGVEDPDDVAGAVIAAVDGIGLCATVAPERWPDSRQVKVMRRILDGVAREITEGATV